MPTGGFVLNALGRHEEAVKKFTRALKRDPDDLESLLSRARSLTALGQHAKAIRDCKRALALGGDRARAYWCWAEVLASQGKQEEAIERLNQAVESDPNNSGLLASLAAALLGVGRPTQAMETARAAIRADPSNSEAYYRLALALWDSDHPAEADAMFTTACDLNPGNPAIVRTWGELLHDMGRHHYAIEKFRAANRLDGNDSGALAGWGHCLCEIGHLAESIAKFSEALGIDARFAPAHAYLAEALTQDGQYEQAMEHLETAASIQPEHWVYRTWAEALIAAGRYEEADEKFRQAANAASRPKDRVGILSAWASNLRRLKRLEDAEQVCQEALKMDPKDADSLLSLAIVAADRGRVAESRERLLDAERYGPATERHFGRLGWALYQIGEYEKSLSYTLRAIELNPNDLATRCNAGLALLHTGKPGEARDQYEQAIRVAEQAAAADAFAYHAVNDVEQAMASKGDLDQGPEILAWLRENLTRLQNLRSRAATVR